MTSKLLMTCLVLSTAAMEAATVTLDNFSNTVDPGAHGIRDATGSLISDSIGFRGAMGYFTITDSQITTSFSGGDLTALAAGFEMFDPVLGFFALNSFADGVFQASESFDTKASSNAFGNKNIYTVFFKGASLTSATELFIAKLTDLFPLDPEIGAPLLGTASLRPSNVTSLLVGSVGANHDYSFGAGLQSTYQLSTVTAVPEPSRALLLLGGVFGLMMRRRRM